MSDELERLIADLLSEANAHNSDFDNADSDLMYEDMQEVPIYRYAAWSFIHTLRSP